MTKVLTTRAGADGVLTLAVSLGEAGANKPVRVVVETLEPAAPVTGPDEWRRFVLGMAGAIADPGFQRHPQGEYERRDELP